ncbi:MAG: tRNA (adenosine(37)-N6)-threonylcarbamoyltransferase complex dimerization subunit type 1 TsaB [Sphingobacteriales bacterium]|nr:tRNA (adenosine(37)-N6)-threonylcarbamoyltransferase complex dimerization subunit type 1 TsaB [Sphingobacteriales bacterium]
MSLILMIDTAQETAFVSISKDGVPIGCIKNDIQKEHAGFLHVAIQDLLKSCEVELKDLDAISVTKGPGSYTGIRVGMASAIGLSYALNKPIIHICSLKLLAHAAMAKIIDPSQVLFCPMIDARRMEVFTGLFDEKLEPKLEPSAMIIDENFMNDFLKNQSICFIGSGKDKFKKIIKSEHVQFLEVENLHLAMATLSYFYYNNKTFASIESFEPAYLKAFQG